MELTDIVARSIDGRVRTIAQFRGLGDERSLSCTVDGSTIAALDGDRNHLYIFKASQVSVYKFDRSLILVLDKPATGGIDWLNRIGERGLLKAFNNLVAVDGGYSRCVFPLLPKRDVRKPLLGILTFDNKSMQRFSIEGPLLAISDDEIRLSKDGCHALFLAFKNVPEILQFTMRQQAVVLKLAASGCKP
jgi:hypothetical protein